jgi:hypothetical protein
MCITQGLRPSCAEQKFNRLKAPQPDIKEARAPHLNRNSVGTLDSRLTETMSAERVLFQFTLAEHNRFSVASRLRISLES